MLILSANGFADGFQCVMSPSCLLLSGGWAFLSSSPGCWWPSWLHCLLSVATQRSCCVSRWPTDSCLRYQLWILTSSFPVRSASFCHFCSFSLYVLDDNTCTHTFADHRYALSGSSCQEELSSWHAVPESKHWLDHRKHVQVKQLNSSLETTRCRRYKNTTQLLFFLTGIVMRTMDSTMHCS